MDTLTATGALTIRPLTVEELPLCEPFGSAFHEEKKVPGDFSPEVFRTNWTLFLNSGLGIIFGLWKDEVLIGGLGGYLSPDITTGELVANEFFWFVQKEDRHGSWPIRLVYEFWAWAKQRGAVRKRMVHLLEPNESPSTVRLAHVYRRLNMRAIEVVYDGVL